MTHPGRLLVLDTSILVHLARKGAASDWIRAHLDLDRRHERPLCSIVSLGEILRFAQQRQWGARQRDLLTSLLNSLMVIDLSHEGVVEWYARLGAASTAGGWNLGQNDPWIAATAVATKSVLVTSDTDFDRLHPDPVERIYLDPAQIRNPIP